MNGEPAPVLCFQTLVSAFLILLQPQGTLQTFPRYSFAINVPSRIFEYGFFRPFQSHSFSCRRYRFIAGPLYVEQTEHSLELRAIHCRCELAPKEACPGLWPSHQQPPSLIGMLLQNGASLAQGCEEHRFYECLY